MSRERLAFECPHCHAVNPSPFPLGMMSTIQDCTIQCRRCGRMYGTGTVSRGREEEDVVQTRRSPFDAVAHRVRVERTANSIERAKDDAEVGRLLDAVGNDLDLPEYLRNAAKWLAKNVIGKLSNKRIAIVLLLVLHYCSRGEPKEGGAAPSPKDSGTNVNINFNLNFDSQMNQWVEQSRHHDSGDGPEEKSKSAGRH